MLAVVARDAHDLHALLTDLRLEGIHMPYTTFFRQQVTAPFRALLLLFLLLAACRAQPTGLEGTWRYDIDRLGEFDQARSADPSPGTSLRGMAAARRRGHVTPTDESAHEGMLRALQREANDLLFVFTRTDLTVEHSDETETFPYRVVSRSGQELTLELTVDGQSNRITAVVQGDQVTLRDEAGRVMYALKKCADADACIIRERGPGTSPAVQPAAGSGSERPSAEECRDAFQNIRRLTGVESPIDEGLATEACVQQSTRDIIGCISAATTLEDLQACEDALL